MYTKILHCLRDVARRKCPEKWTNNSWFLLHNNAPANWPVLVMDFFAKKNFTTLQYPPYSPYLAAADFYLLPRLKSALNGWHFFDATDIIKNETEQLKRLSQNSFQECFQPLCSRWQKCIVAQGDYCEGNVV